MNNLLKITSGKFRGRSIKSPGSTLTHPMGAREKLALFNMISDFLPDARVLDAFAGSGALGIEAISRGAKEVVFVEKSPKIANTIKQNLKDLEIKAQVFVKDVANYIDKEGFDVIIADPPYDNFKIEATKHLASLLKSGGILILSHPEDGLELSGLRLLKTRQYASAHISIYAK